MPDYNSTLDLVVEQLQQNADHTALLDAVWQIMLMIGSGLLLVLVVVAVVVGAYGLTKGWRRTPPLPRSIIPAQSTRRRRYTEKKRR